MKEVTDQYTCIPDQLYLDMRISDGATLLYGIILSLCTEYGYCPVTNKTLGGVRNVSPRIIRLQIENLKDCGYIKVEYEGKHGEERRIYPQILPDY